MQLNDDVFRVYSFTVDGNKTDEDRIREIKVREAGKQGTGGREVPTPCPPVLFPGPSYQNLILSTRKRKASVFKFLGFEERFGKAPF